MTRTITVDLEPGELVCRIAREIAETEDWQECAAYRIVRVNDDEVRVQIALDLETLTAPEPA